MSERVVGLLGCSEADSRLELVVEGEGMLALRFATHTEGLGWQVQKTIRIEAGQVEELRFLLGGARHLLKTAKSCGDRATATVVPFKERTA